MEEFPGDLDRDPLYMNNQKISKPKDENIKRKREMIDLVASGEAVLIVGAGSSARVGHPTWPCLLKKLTNLAKDCDDGFKIDCKEHRCNLLKYTEHIKSHIYRETGDLYQYYALLERSFEPKNPEFHPLHETLVSLPFRGILTTNYDMVLEAALAAIEQSRAYNYSLIIDEDSAGQVHNFLQSMADIRIPRRIAHLHGIYDNPKRIILSSKDYERAYGLTTYEATPEFKRSQKVSGLKSPSTDKFQTGSKWTLHRKLLWTVLATRRVVFVGFSMCDPYLNKMLETVSKDLWRWHKSVHYAIIDTSLEREDEYRKAEKLRRCYGIDTVFYENADGSYEGLDLIVNEIAEECGVEIKSTIMSQNQSDDKYRFNNKESSSVTRNPRVILNWIQRLNERWDEED